MKKYIIPFLLVMGIGLPLLSQTSNRSSKKQWAQYDRYAAHNKALQKAPDVGFMGNSITDNWALLVPEFFVGNIWEVGM